jgi:galacturan 1,4-alpha-galacturonidase
MKFTLPLAVLSASAALVGASCVSRRPTLNPMPYTPRVPFPSPPKRTRVCTVETHGDGITDDSQNILTAFHACNGGGHVLFPRGKTFIIGTAMDWTFLKNIDIGKCGDMLEVETHAFLGRQRLARALVTCGVMCALRILVIPGRWTTQPCSLPS